MEQTIFTAQPSFRIARANYILAGFFFLVGLLMHFFYFFAILFLLGGIVGHLKRNNTIYTLTTEKIKIKTGVIGKAENNIPLSKIQNVASAYSVSQRLFGVGSVVIESAGGRIGGIALKDIEKSDEYAKQILDTIHKKELTGIPYTSTV